MNTIGKFLFMIQKVRGPLDDLIWAFVLYKEHLTTAFVDTLKSEIVPSEQVNVS